MPFFLTLLSNAALQFLLLIGAPAAAGLVLSWLAARTNSVYRRFVFPRLGLYVFGPLGIPVHEFSHYAFCRLFGLKVQKVKWFDAKGRDGAHGSVVHSYDPWSLRHRVGHVFVGLAPVLIGPAAIALCFHLIGRHPAFTALPALFELPWPVLAPLLYVSLAISSQLELSREDLGVAASGLAPAFVILLVLNLGAGALRIDAHAWIIGRGLEGLRAWAQVLGLTAALSALHWIAAWLFASVIHLLLRREPIHPLR